MSGHGVVKAFLNQCQALFQKSRYFRERDDINDLMEYSSQGINYINPAGPGGKSNHPGPGGMFFSSPLSLTLELTVRISKTKRRWIGLVKTSSKHAKKVRGQGQMSGQIEVKGQNGGFQTSQIQSSTNKAMCSIIS